MTERTALAANLNFPASLPISEKREEIVAALRAHQVIIVAGETGSGKTTQLPKMCLEAGLGLKGQIGCTQPRRVAALSVSRRIAEELSVTWGREVGAKIRFADKTQRETIIKVMTDGILLAELRSDPLLKRYQAIIIDEAHERSLNIDFLLGYLKGLIAKRPDLKLIITSATIDTALFSAAFGNAPIFEVSGRLYPVEVRYVPLATEDEEVDGVSHVDGAVAAVESLLRESHEGDLLVFMPTERDIRETKDRLVGRFGDSLEVLPLMGSLSAAEQERVFRLSPQRRAIVATNIAETSITIPNIRYVVDTGLARISRYEPRTRTKRLPIERIAKSSVQQRTGRAGRVREGVCVRLFSEEEFASRTEYTDPEIRRANLAEVILRMKAFGLGDVEEFPFLNPPTPRAIRSGYELLRELGALDSAQNLTNIGRELARLPVDPTIGRMLLQARKERCLPEVLVIAAGLSVQDPRERPMEKRERADEAHKAFLHPDSDFLTLLNLWNAYQREADGGRSYSSLRRFCKAHFLSFLRMREWLDVHRELSEAVRGKDRERATLQEVRDAATIKRFDGNYRAIHRAILSGLLGQVAYRREANLYQASANRQVTIFPGSALSERRPRRGEAERRPRRAAQEPSRERWIVAGELVETSRLFARTAAYILPSWIEEVGAHLCRRVVEDPRWEERTGTVIARERVTLGGMVLAYRKVAYARIDAVAAKEIFIRHALLGELTPVQHPIVQRNRRLCDKIGTRLALAGRLDRARLEERLLEFYMRRLPSLASVAEFERWAKEHLAQNSTQLEVTMDDLLAGEQLPDAPVEFPDSLQLAGSDVDLYYRYEPGGARDGVTLALPLQLAQQVPARLLDGAVPGLRSRQVAYLLRNLPKKYRSTLPRIDEVAQRITADPRFAERPLIEGIIERLQHDFDLTVPPELLTLEKLPDYLRIRIEVVEEGQIIEAGRNLHEIQQKLSGVSSGDELAVWSVARREWERDEVTTWDFGELPAQIEVSRVGDTPLLAYPAVVVEGERVALRLLQSREEAIARSREGVDQLLSLALSRELQVMQKQAKAADELKHLIVLFDTPAQLREGVFIAAKRFVLHRESRYPLRQQDFEAALEEARSRAPKSVYNVLEWTKQILEQRRAVLSQRKSYPGMREELDALVPAGFLFCTPYDQLQHLPRFLKAMLVRAERADSNPGADKVKAARVAPYLEALRNLTREHPLRWMIEEFKVSVFAQELGTAYRISSKAIDQALDTMNR